MEDRNTKVVTFRNHYGALMLKKALGDDASVRAVPRSLSSSCGTCTFVEDKPLEVVLEASRKDLLEGIYQKEGEEYSKIYG